MGARAESAARTGRAILTATSELWRERALDEITLQEIAERAGVTVQTVLRRFGTKEGVVAACLDADAAGVRAERNVVRPGDVAGAVDVLLGHYERDGDAVLRTLAIEERIPAAKLVCDRGRREHRAWCARVFAPYLPPPDGEAYAGRLDAFVAATDVYLWKLSRRDLGHEPERTRRLFWTLLDALVGSHPPSP
jgi:AcrR family transcriptional regulator